MRADEFYFLLDSRCFSALFFLLVIDVLRLHESSVRLSNMLENNKISMWLKLCRVRLALVLHLQAIKMLLWFWVKTRVTSENRGSVDTLLWNGVSKWWCRALDFHCMSSWPDVISTAVALLCCFLWLASCVSLLPKEKADLTGQQRALTLCHFL